MSAPEIPLAAARAGRRAEEELALEVLRSGRLSLGPVQERFERELAAWLGVDDAVAVSSGTAALHLGVAQLGWGEGDEVVTSPFSFVASANCLLYEGATPVFADIDPVTLNLDPDAARAAVGRADGGDPAGAHLRLPRRDPGVGCAGEGAWPWRARGLLRGAGRGRRRRHECGRPREPRDVRLLREQAADHRRGRDDRSALARRGGDAAQRAQPGRVPSTWAGSTTTGWASTTA